MDEFKTPIYRIVNGADPVTLVPPTGLFFDALKGLVRILATIVPFAKVLDLFANWLVKQQRFRHVGDMRYLSMHEPNSPDLTLEYSLSSTRRFIRLVGRIRNGEAKRIDKYHSMERYLDKLAAIARRYN